MADAVGKNGGAKSRGQLQPTVSFRTRSAFGLWIRGRGLSGRWCDAGAPGTEYGYRRSKNSAPMGKTHWSASVECGCTTTVGRIKNLSREEKSNNAACGINVTAVTFEIPANDFRYR
jgi:hypothetical protein